MLDITDNLDADGRVVPPVHVVRHDGDDPYLVVAADKGTATFSDIANGVSARLRLLAGRRLRLRRLASATTTRRWASPRAARGRASSATSASWALDTQTTPFSVVGVGDMSGDVFGNGMLRSETDAAAGGLRPPSHLRRSRPRSGRVASPSGERLFDLPRSSWADYDRTKLSQGRRHRRALGQVDRGHGRGPRGARHRRRRRSRPTT